ncbi:MAG: enoyl-CoA hydratase/isomerase family protein [Firmicutes bacterium]|nr:enoyl-CoA hydratase/isomerase family protein [Alicyclobacillaceae bacterium]MCL6497459.1 enoyl-CoA hydratase/isomerase family protein [Bacillota bacterium]
MEWETVSVELRPGWAVVTMQRPKVLNALNRRLRQELVAVLDHLADQEHVRGLVLTGAGRAFSVGQDLAEMEADYRDGAPQLGRLVREEYVPMVEALYRFPKPTLALVHGPAAGGGLSLALACDLRVLTADATLIPAFIKVGLAPDTGAAYHAVRQLGYARALEWFWSGRALGADQAQAWGLAHWVAADAETAWERVATVMEELSQGPTRAYVEVRRLLHQVAASPWETALIWEIEAQDRLGQTEDHREAVAAFLAKRPPQFQGR